MKAAPLGYAERLREALNAIPVELRPSLRDLAAATGFSYEHLRKTINGAQPVVSETLNDRLSKVLKLDTVAMWKQALAEKAARRSKAAPDAVSGPRSRMQKLWEELTPEDRRQLTYLADALVTARQVKRRRRRAA